jgi:hypothetical protein
MMGANKYMIGTLVLAAASILLSCGKESSCFKGSGTTITEARNITNDVTKVIMEDNVDLIIIQDSIASLELEGGENLMPFINTGVSGNSLKISSDNSCGFFRNYDRPLTAYLRIPNLTHIEYTGQGNISSSGKLNFTNFEFDTRKGTGSVNLNLSSNFIAVRQHTGPSDITITGNTNNAYYYAGGNGWMYFEHLEANTVHVNNDGSGDISLQSSNSLLVELRSLGNIIYYGNPDVTISVKEGKGELIKK